MRKEELKTVSNAHKSTVHAAEGVGFSLNTDGTTKAPKKLGRVVINDVVSVNHLPDGSAVSAISDISRELDSYLRKTATALGLPILIA